VELRTGIERIGRSSFVVAQEAWQEGQCVARGKAVQVYFDFASQKSDVLPEHIREQLAACLIDFMKR
jgi:acyl-CoA thioester hydrolase